MSFTFDISDQLRETLKKLRTDKHRLAIIDKKIKEILACNGNTIEHYKNLRHDLSDCKRVHIDNCFVLIFKVRKNEGHILFERLDHHDKAYKH